MLWFGLLFTRIRWKWSPKTHLFKTALQSLPRTQASHTSFSRTMRTCFMGIFLRPRNNAQIRSGFSQRLRSELIMRWDLKWLQWTSFREKQGNWKLRKRLWKRQFSFFGTLSQLFSSVSELFWRWIFLRTMCTSKRLELWGHKGDVTRDDTQRRF